MKLFHFVCENRLLNWLRCVKNLLETLNSVELATDEVDCVVLTADAGSSPACSAYRWVDLPRRVLSRSWLAPGIRQSPEIGSSQAPDNSQLIITFMHM
jgi:hypothetical protein